MGNDCGILYNSYQRSNITNEIGVASKYLLWSHSKVASDNMEFL